MSKSEENIAEVMEGGRKELYQLMAARMSSERENKAGEGSSTYQRIRPTISRVPKWLRKLKPSAYTPRVVSIGPLHRKDRRLTGMEDAKFRYMHTLFDRTAKSEETLKDDADQTLSECLDAMLEAAPRALTCYAETLEKEYSIVKLANTLLVDGCFILELLFRCKHLIIEDNDPVFMNYLALGGIRRDLLLLENQIPFFVLEKLFKHTLHKIHNIHSNYSRLSLKQYVLEFLSDMRIFGSKMTEGGNGTTETSYDHILGFLHNYYKPSSNEGEPGDYPVVKYSATQLHSAGVKFKASKGEHYLLVRFRTSCLMFAWMRTLHQMVCSWLRQKPTNSDPERNEVKVDIVPSAEAKAVSAEEEKRSQKPPNCLLFSWLQPAGQTVREPTEVHRVKVQKKERNDQSSPQTSSICSTLLHQTSRCLFSWLFHLCSSTCLELPKLCVGDTTESFFRNLIAYEQCCFTIPHYFTSYAFLMDTLINSKEDVELLENEGVLQNILGASEDASNLFNNLCKEIFLTKFYFSDQWNQLKAYSDLYWPKHLASLRRTYFSNPWAFISLIGALLLFGLTAVQTAYTMKSYKFSLHPTKPT